MRKRGQTKVITAILIILLVLTSVVIVWNVVKKTLVENSKQVEISQLATKINIEEVQMGNITNAKIKVKRDSGGGEISSLKFIFNDANGNSYVYNTNKINDIPDVLETRIIDISNVSYLNRIVEINKVSVIPVFSDDRLGLEVDKKIENKIFLPTYELVSWWKFDGDFNDNIGNNHGTGFGGANTSGNFLNLDGVDDYVSVPHSQSLNFGTKDFSISFWVKVPFSGSNWAGIITKGITTSAPANTWGFLRRSSDVNRAAFQQATDSGGTFGASLISSFLNEDWQHIVVKRNESITQIYVNGSYWAEDTTAGDNLITTADLRFGRTGGTSSFYFQGFIDKVMIFNRSLSSQEILNIYNQQKKS
jgi:hypothetical protein